MKAKDTTVETLRGAVILLVVVGHVIGSAGDGGMKVADDSFLRYFYYTVIDPIQMPLFTILAGWVYALRPPVYEQLKSFTIKKVMRLLVPMLMVGILYFVIQHFTPGTNAKSDLGSIWKLLFFPYTLFWYLYSLFMVFIIVGLLDVFKKLQTIRQWVVVFSLSIVALLVRDVFIPFEAPNYLSYKGTLYLLPCFVLGLGLYRFKSVLQTKKMMYSAAVVLAICIVVQQLSWFKVIDYTVQKDDVFGLFIGFTTTMLLLRSRLEIKPLVWVGSFAYSIYLFHAFGTAAGRLVLQKLSINATVPIFIISLLTGLVLAIVAEKVLERFSFTRALFLGRG